MVAIQFYRKFITEFVREQMIVLGPNLAVDTANRAEGITINNRGQVVVGRAGVFKTFTTAN